MNNYYFYRMTCDTGNAPCVFEKGYKSSNILTLACCKGGQIRKGKPVKTGLRHTVGNAMSNKSNDNQYIIGILKDRIVFVAKIKEAVLMADYFSNENYRKRMDCIYDVIDDKNEWRLKRREDFNPDFHGQDCTDQHQHDELGEYVLISEEFIYQGSDKSLNIDPSISHLMPKHQETKHYTDNDKGSDTIKQFVEQCINKGKQSNFVPTEYLGVKSCKAKRCQK